MTGRIGDRASGGSRPVSVVVAGRPTTMTGMETNEAPGHAGIDLDAVRAAITAAGTVTCSTAQLVDGRAFKHADHPLDAATTALEELGVDLDWTVRDQIWRSLVAEHLLPLLPYQVTLTDSSYNSAWAWLVDGLTENQDALGYVEVSVDPAALAQTFIEHLVADEPISQHPADRPARPSAVTSGLAGLVGRRVNLAVTGSDEQELAGTLLACTADALVLCQSGEGPLTVVPLASLRWASTYQLTADEFDATIDLDW